MIVVVWVLVGAGALVLLQSAVRFVREGLGRQDPDAPEIPLIVPLAFSPSPAEGEAPPVVVPMLSQPQLEASLFEGRTIRFHRPAEKTLQTVPGRLEVVAGEDRSEEIRFVRIPGAPVEVTLGRKEGEPLRHIQFRAPTVSRDHARMAYTDSRWVITNHSGTNPVIVNGVELIPPRNQHVLTDGDHIEMGEVVFRFHER